MHVHVQRQATHTHKTHTEDLFTKHRKGNFLGVGRLELSNMVCILVVGHGQHILPVRVVYHRAKPLLAENVTFMTIS